MLDVHPELARRGYTRADIERLRDPAFRLSCGLYKIVDKEKNVIPFRPKAEQRRIIDAVFNKGQLRWIIVKARQIGFSTLIELLGFDACYFGENIQCSIVDQNQVDASKKLREKCKFAFDQLPPELKTNLVADSGTRLEFSNNSVINAGMNARGGTNHFLHISELGPIAFKDPSRAEEVRTGALPSVPDNGMCFIESSYMGGRGGFFYEMIKRAQEVPEEQKTVKDFRLLFSPWHDDPGYSLDGDASRISRDTHTYLDEVERSTGKTFTIGQRLWYQVTAEEQGIFMFREYPSLIEECFRAPVEGAIYANLLARARAEGRIYKFTYDRAYPVYTSWDIGHSDTTDVWWWQLRGNRWDIVKHVSLKRHSAAQAANVIRDAGIPVSMHYLPHDSKSSTAASGSNYITELAKAGIPNTRTVPRTHDIWIGINQICDLLPRAQINLDGCAAGIAALEVYHSKDEAQAGRIIVEPVHDWSSHAADALRTAAEAISAGMVSDTSAISRQRAHAERRGMTALSGGVRL